MRPKQYDELAESLMATYAKVGKTTELQARVIATSEVRLLMGAAS